MFIIWFKFASDEKKSDFYNWLVQKDTDKRHDSIVSVVETLPIYKFAENIYLSKNEVLADNSKIVMRNGHEKLRDIFSICGYDCSYNIDDLPISKFSSDNVIFFFFPSFFIFFEIFFLLKISVTSHLKLLSILSLVKALTS